MTLVLSALPLTLPHWPGIVSTYLMCAAIWHVVDQFEEPKDD